MSDSAPKRKLLDQLRDILRAKHYSYSTAQTDVGGWVRRYEKKKSDRSACYFWVWKRSL